MFQRWWRSEQDGKRLPWRVAPPCRYVWGCWRPGCVYVHDEGGDRQEHVRDLAELWARAAAVAESAAEAGPLEIAKNRATTEIEVAESGGEGEAGFSRSRATTTAPAATVAKYVGDARPRDIAKYCATATGTTVAKLVGEAWPPETAAEAVVTTTGAKSVGEARPPETAAEAVMQQQAPSLLVMLGFVILRSTVPRLPVQQSQSLLVSLASGDSNVQCHDYQLNSRKVRWRR